MNAPIIKNSCWKHWVDLPDGRVQCSACKTIRDSRRHRVCRSESEQAAAVQAARAKRPRSKTQLAKPPGLVRRFGRWLVAMNRWAYQSVKNRRLMIRAEAEYLRVRKICEACPQWNADKEQCNHCGCGGKSKVVLLNKLRLESEKCPDGKW